jgi:XTP/dITP diphosphohydrolase
VRAGPILETILYARDLAAARHFYGNILGLDAYRALANRFVFFRSGAQMLLIFNPELSSAQNLADGPPPHGTTGSGHVCFRASRNEQVRWEGHLAGHGIAIEKRMEWPDGGQSLYLRDPAGNSVEFAEARIWELPETRSLRETRVVIATHNKGKLVEFSSLLAPYGTETVSAGELGLAEPAETETSFSGNASIKAEAAMTATGLPAIADDSGLCVEALDGEPGVFTADWAGPDRNWTRAMELVESKLQAKGATTPESRRASFACTLCVAWPDGERRFYVGRAPGRLVWPPRGTLGHGYDPVFVPDGETRTFGEMTLDEKNTLSHRGNALRQLLSDLL